MIRRTAAALAALICCIYGTAGAGEGDAGQASPDRYQTIVEKNVFSRNRGPRMRRETPTVTQEYRPERNMKLTGIVRQDGEYIAFLEDTRAQKTTRVRAGESVLSGRIKSIELDRIEYEAGDATTAVAVGERLDSTPGSVSASEDSAVPATAPSETPQAAASGGTAGAEGAAAIMERLRQRRQRELGQ